MTAKERIESLTGKEIVAATLSEDQTIQLVVCDEHNNTQRIVISGATVDDTLYVHLATPEPTYDDPGFSGMEFADDSRKH